MAVSMLIESGEVPANKKKKKKREKHFIERIIKERERRAAPSGARALTGNPPRPIEKRQKRKKKNALVSMPRVRQPSCTGPSSIFLFKTSFSLPSPLYPLSQKRKGEKGRKQCRQKSPIAFLLSPIPFFLFFTVVADSERMSQQGIR